MASLSSSDPPTSEASIPPLEEGTNRKKRKRDDTTPNLATPNPPVEPEVTVLSHARQRKENKRLKKSLKEASSDVLNVDTHAKSQSDLAAPDPPPRKNSIWIGNLAFKTTPEQLKDFFAEAGEITRINMPTKPVGGPEKQKRGENRGFAYLDFATPEAKKLAISYSERNLDGRRLLIKDGDDFTGRPAPPAPADDVLGTPPATAESHATPLSKTAKKILHSQKQPVGPVLFMGNLGFETTQETIKDMIEGHHRALTAKQEKNQKKTEEPTTSKEDTASLTGLKRVRLGTFEDSGKCKGWAFLDFESPQHASAVLVNPKNHHLNGRNLVLEFASPDAVRRGGYRFKEVRKENDGVLAGGEDKRRQPYKKPQNVRDYGGKAKPTNPSGPHDDGEQHDLASDRRSPKRARVEVQQPSQEKLRRRGPTAGRGGDNTTRARPKPGAALAQAQREKIAIVPSKGKKIVF